MAWQEILKEAPRVDDRNRVQYFEIRSKSILNQVRAPDLPFDLSLNPYLNCEVGCAYCYAREFSGKRSGGEGSFEQEIYIKRNAPELLASALRRLRRLDQQGRVIALGTATDPYQPVEKRSELTRSLLKTLSRFPGLRLSITTKSDLILRDLDLLKALSETSSVRVNVSLITPDRDLARSLDPRAPTPKKRLRAVEKLTRAGIPTGVFCMPVIPDITDRSQDLRRLVCAAKTAGASWFTTRTLSLGPEARVAFFAWLERERPALLPRYRRRYRGAQAPAPIRNRIESCLNALRQQYRLPAHLPFPPAKHVPRPRQLELFDPEPQKLPRSLPMFAEVEEAAERAAGAA